MHELFYITGAGRSGSTLVDILLGSQDDCFSCGELINLVRAYLNGEYCSCRNQLKDCACWHQVIAAWQGQQKLTETEMRRFADLDRLYGHPRRLRAWLGALCPGVTKRHRWYLQQLAALLGQIARTTGRRALIDSSKSPVRLLTIARVWPGKIKAIHLVRHPCGVVESLSKPYAVDDKAGIQNDLPARSAFRTTLFWVIINLMAEFAIKRINKPSIRLRYEDVIDNPAQHLSSIISDFALSEPLVPEHVCAGNRMRMKNAIEVGKREPSEVEQEIFLIRILCKNILRRYGYSFKNP